MKSQARLSEGQINSIYKGVSQYLADLAGRPATIHELVEHVNDPWLRPVSSSDVITAVENLCVEGLLKEYRNAQGCPFYRLANNPTSNEPGSSSGEDS